MSSPRGPRTPSLEITPSNKTKNGVFNLTLTTPEGRTTHLKLSPSINYFNSNNNSTFSQNEVNENKIDENNFTQNLEYDENGIIQPTSSQANVNYDDLQNAINNIGNDDNTSIPINESDEIYTSLIPKQFNKKPIQSTIQNTGFIDPKNQETWPEWAKRHAHFIFVKPFKKGYEYATKHPIAVFMGILFALPDGINAFCGWAGIAPVDLLYAIPNMSITTLIFAAINAFCGIAINATMNSRFFPTAWDGLKNGFTKCSESVEGTIGNTASLILGLSAFAAAFGICYTAFAWLPASTITALLPALFKGIATFTGRYVQGVSTIISNVKGLFDEDMKLQKEAYDLLNHLKAEYLESVNEFLRNELLNDDAIAKLFEAIDKQPDILDKKSILEKISQFLGKVFDVLYTLVIATNVFPTFGQKGFDGIKELTGLFTRIFGQINPLESFDDFNQILTGMLPASASTIFYGIGASGTRDKLVRLWERFLENPVEIFHILPLMAANAFSGSGMYSVATNVAINPPHSDKNVFGIPQSGSYNNAYRLFNGIGAASVNLGATVDPYLKKDLPDSSPTVQDIKHYLQQEKLSHNTVDQLRNCGIFQPKPSSNGKPKTTVTERSGLVI